MLKRLFIVAGLLGGCGLSGVFSLQVGPDTPANDLSAPTDLASPKDLGPPIDLAGVDELPPGTCGNPGQPCCTGLRCEGGGCCELGTCVASGSALNTAITTICWRGAPTGCGVHDAPCCAGGECLQNGCCVGGICRSTTLGCGPLGACNDSSCLFTVSDPGCGGKENRCCPGAPPGHSGAGASFCTASGLACDQALLVCTACGDPGEPCCDNNVCMDGACCDQSALTPTCRKPGDECGDGAGTCQAGGCAGGTCGKLGQACCPGLVGCTAPFVSCQNGTCRPCGGGGQPCCPGTGGNGMCATGYVCNQTSRCDPCGGPGQLCCAGGVCNGPLTCNAMNGLCQ